MREAVALDRPRVMLDVMTLAKPELTFLAMLTTVAGFLLGTAETVDPVVLLVLLLGTALVGGGAGALNQYLERGQDALMRRTMHRPLPSGRLLPGTVLAAGLIASFAGVLILWAGTNRLTGMLALATLLLYLLVYTPLKRSTPVSTLIGAIPGALPPLMGWTAAANEFGQTGWLLFVILYLWQMPHFWALAWMYRKDYERAGYRLLPVVDRDGRTTGTAMTLFCVMLVLVPLGLTAEGRFGVLSVVGTLSTGLTFTGFALAHLRSLSNTSARRVFFASLFYLPALLLFFVIDRLV